MAHQQAYQAYPQNKGTLIPGQTIAVNNYTVQVERYLSQGGFAHVYLVRTPQPVYNTTHHVLKRIAVSNEAMLTDVKKEVDIMRLLKGHPNIVHLIDASWHKLPNGTFEVFILMEFCPGGGIIDMMNRRLRERLTEAEILQIFVDVCEGVAYMHNSRPPLLHRDLKVENILQSSPTSFKLCDFGSATTVSNAPTNMQEIRALEADLNRHTTLQYRAPEMVDVYSKRPINEKSDVWALGVLLYKLCYYTTPFEEHGPLAILNVQYRIPPYPVYSQDMNMLIASMLREHGAQRPTVFELLNHVHRLRGTRSKFSYSVPSPQPALSRSQGYGKPTPLSSPNPMDGVVTFGVSSSSTPNMTPANQGIQARDRVLEAIAPMRRGRPTVSREQNAISRPASPQRLDKAHMPIQENSRDTSYTDFTVEQERAWKAATERSSTQAQNLKTDDAAWNFDKPSNDVRKTTKSRPAGFGDDFAESLWTAPDPNSQTALRPQLSPSPNKVAMSVQRSAEAPITPLAFTGGSRIRVKQDRLIPAKDNRDKDAFEGLGLMTNAPKTAPTLGEARKLRTGLAIMSTSSGAPQSDYVRESDTKHRTASQRPTPSPQLQSRYLSTTPLIPQPVSPIPTPGSFNNMLRSSNSPSGSGAGPPSATSDGTAIEARFPSLEELDAQFSPVSNPLYPSSINDASSSQMTRQPTNRLQHSSRIGNVGSSGTGGNYLKPAMSATMSYALDGTRSEQVTGSAMREIKDAKRFPEASAGASWTSPTAEKDSGLENNSSSKDRILQPKPLVVRKHRSSVTMKPSFTSNIGKGSETADNESSITSAIVPPKLPPRPAPSNTSQRDWLTGDDQDSEEIKPHLTPDVPVLRDSPSKRASFIENSDFRIVSSSVAQRFDVPVRKVDDSPSADLSPTVSKFNRAFPALDLEPFDADKLKFSFSNTKTDLWASEKNDTAESVDSSSVDDEGPEEPDILSTAQKRQAARSRGRQSSVHDLVYQYGGGLPVKDKERESQKDPEKDRPKPSVQYNVGASDYTPRKFRPSMPGLGPPATQRPTQTTPSPTSTTNAPPLEYKHHPATADRPSQPPPHATKPSLSNNDVKSPPSARSRPQSMFIFPSKSVESSSTLPTTPINNNLLPPSDSRPRATRRTSISDMVQLYEAIGNTSKPMASIAPPAPAPIQKPVVGRPSPALSESNRALKPSDTGRVASSKVTTSSSNNSRQPDLNRSKTQLPSKETIRKAATSSPSPSKVHRKLTLDRETPAAEETTPRPKRMSIRATPMTVLPPRADSLASSRSTKSSSTMNSAINDSPRKLPISLTEDVTNVPANTSTKEEPRSPSPERPYQGVGRLIDQWQKKSAEAEGRPVPSGKRDALPKRAGIIHGDDR
ncbi:hypothetical protein BDN70DRAFT_988034 [Pholiota conissans]|uniref:non-specific serine/threonine protein kinase n=1 Tax=Pholiota conissans TaxID=109636 RepID=A0A9P5ZH02_9AGAR|nr:hypothetical protein BDN70DRAFT_988034 [Pholiota conissans]